MSLEAPSPTRTCADGPLPRIVFVLGKGGVGRSTIAAGLALRRAAQGERVLVVEWAVADPIGPWFGHPEAGPTPMELAPRLAVTNFSLEEALRAYFVDHLHLGLVYRHVLHRRAVRSLLAVAPGLSEMLFLGQLWWLITLAEAEAGLRFDRIVVDAPATGHASSMLDIPTTVAAMSVGSLLAVETRRVTDMMEDPARVGAVVVTLPEPLVIEETLELVPRITARLGRPPLGIVINRSAAWLAARDPADDAAPWLAPLAAQLSPPQARQLCAIQAELEARLALEEALRGRLTGVTAIALGELPGTPPRTVAEAAAGVLGPLAPAATPAPIHTPIAGRAGAA